MTGSKEIGKHLFKAVLLKQPVTLSFCSPEPESYQRWDDEAIHPEPACGVLSGFLQECCYLLMSLLSPLQEVMRKSRHNYPEGLHGLGPGFPIEDGFQASK